MNNIMNNIFAIGKTDTFGNKPLNGLFDILPGNSEKGIPNSENSFKGFIESFAQKLVSHNNSLENNQAIGKENFIELNDKSPMNLHLYKLENSNAEIDNPLASMQPDVIDASEITIEPGQIKSDINSQIENGNFVKEEIRSSVDSSKNPQFDSNISNINSGIEKKISQETNVITNSDPSITEKFTNELQMPHDTAQSNVAEDTDTGLNITINNSIEKESNTSTSGIEINNTEIVNKQVKPDSNDDNILSNDFDLINPEFVDHIIPAQTPVEQTISVSNNAISEHTNTQEGRFGEYVIDARLASQKGRNSLFEKIVSSDEYKELAEQIELVKNTDDILSKAGVESKFAQQITPGDRSIGSNEIPDQVTESIAKYGLDMNSSVGDNGVESLVRNDNRAGLLYDNPVMKDNSDSVEIPAGSSTISVNTEKNGIPVDNKTHIMPEKQFSSYIMGNTDNMGNTVSSGKEHEIQFTDRNTIAQNNSIQTQNENTLDGVTESDGSFNFGDENSSVQNVKISDTQAENNIINDPETGETQTNEPGVMSGRIVKDKPNVQYNPKADSEIVDTETGEVRYTSESTISPESIIQQTPLDPNSGEIISKPSIQNNFSGVGTIEQVPMETLDNGTERVTYNPETGEVITQNNILSEKPEHLDFTDTELAKTDTNAQTLSRAKFVQNADSNAPGNIDPEQQIEELRPPKDSIISQARGEQVQTESVEQLGNGFTENSENSIIQPNIYNNLQPESNIENIVSEQDRISNKNDFPKLNNISEQKQTALIDEDSQKYYAFNEVMEPNNQERDFYSEAGNAQKSNNAVDSLRDSTDYQNRAPGIIADNTEAEIDNSLANEQANSQYSEVSEDTVTGSTNIIEQNGAGTKVLYESKTDIQSSVNLENHIPVERPLRENINDVLHNGTEDRIPNTESSTEGIISENTSNIGVSKNELSGNSRDLHSDNTTQRENAQIDSISSETIENGNRFDTIEETVSSSNNSFEKQLSYSDLHVNTHKEQSSEESVSKESPLNNTLQNNSNTVNSEYSENIERGNLVFTGEESFAIEENTSNIGDLSEKPLIDYDSPDNTIKERSSENLKSSSSISHRDNKAGNLEPGERINIDHTERSNTDSVSTISESTISENRNSEYIVRDSNTNDAIVDESITNDNTISENIVRINISSKAHFRDGSVNHSDANDLSKDNVLNGIDSDNSVKGEQTAKENPLRDTDIRLNNANLTKDSGSFDNNLNENIPNNTIIHNDLSNGNIANETIQTENISVEKTQAGNVQLENGQYPNSPADNTQFDRTQTEDMSIDTVQFENTQTENMRTESSQHGNDQTANIQAESVSLNNAQTDSKVSENPVNSPDSREKIEVEDISTNDSSLAGSINSKKNASDVQSGENPMLGITNSDAELNIDEIEPSMLFTPSEEMATETSKFETSLIGENIDDVIKKYYNIERKPSDTTDGESKTQEETGKIEELSSDKINLENIENVANDIEPEISSEFEMPGTEHTNTNENASEDVHNIEAKKNTKITPRKKPEHIINEKDIEDAREELEIDIKKHEIPEKEIKDSYIKRKPKVESTFDIKAEEPEQSLSGTSNSDSHVGRSSDGITPKHSAMQDAVERAKLRRANIKKVDNVKTETEYPVNKTHISGNINIPHSESVYSNSEKSLYTNETGQEVVTKPGIENPNGGISENSDSFVDIEYVQEEAKLVKQTKTEFTSNNKETSSDKNINLSESQNKENNAENDDWQKKLLNFENIRKFSKGAISDSDYQVSKNGSETEKTVSDLIENEIGRVMNSSDIKWRIKNMSNYFDTQDKKVESKSSLDKVNIDVSTQEAPVLKREVVDSQMSKENELPLSSLPMRERVNNVQYDSDYESLGNRDSVLDSSFGGFETPEGKAGTYEGGYSDLTEKNNNTGLSESNTFIGNISFDKVTDSSFEALEPKQIDIHNEHIENPDMASYEQFDKLTYIAPQNPSKHGELKHNPSNYQMSELFRNSNPSQTAVSGTEYSAQVIGNSNEVSSMKPDDNSNYRDRKKAEVEDSDRVTEPLSYRDNFMKVTSPKEAYRTNSEGESNLLKSRDRTAVQDNVVNDSLSQNNNLFNPAENAQSVSSVNNGKIANSVDDIFGSLLHENTKDIKPSALEILDLTTDWLRSQNNMEGKMALNDSALGEINVHFKTEGDKLRVRFEVAAKESKEQLLSGVENFRRVMSKGGYNEVTVDIDHHENSGENQSAPNNSEQNLMGNHGQTGNGNQGYRGNNRFRKNQFDTANSNQNYSIPHIMGQLRNETATMHVVA